MKKIKRLTKEEIEAKKEELRKEAKQTIEEVKSGKRTSPATDFLNEIKEIVKEMLDNGVSYVRISKTIYDVYSFRVSEQTIRAFAHSALGVPKRSRQKSTQKAESSKPKSASEIKEETAKKRAENKGKATL